MTTEDNQAVKLPTVETITQQELDAILSENAEFKQDNETLKRVAFGIMKILNLVDENGKPKPELMTKDEEEKENVMPHILKGIGDTMALLTQASIPVLGRSAKKKLAERFAFITEFIPIIEKHGKGY